MFINNAIESKVQERTLELSQANELLKQEIVERKRFELALEESEKQFRFLADNIPQIVWTVDQNGELDY